MFDEYKNSRLSALLRPLHNYAALLGAYSFFFNLLLLVPPMYMLTVFDRAVGARSESTLLVLTIIMVLLLGAMGFLGWARNQLVQRAAAKVHRLLAQSIFDVGYKRSVYSPQAATNAQSLQDLHGIKRFVASAITLAIFDAPFTPIFIIVMFLFHLYFGLIALFGLLVLVALNILNERTNTVAVQKADVAYAAASTYAQRNFANAEVIEAMGLVDSVRKKWEHDSDTSVALQVEAGESAGILLAISRAFRLIIQSLTLGLGAYLAINQEISPGMMIAGSILLGRALGPVDQLIGGWSGFVTAREQFKRLMDLFENMPPPQQKTQLPPPTGKLSVEKAIVALPGSSDPILKGISFALQAGTHLGIVGPSGAGKSTLARALLGLWPCQRGSIRLDGADIFLWDRKQLGPYIGYLPQDMELLDGSISDNIARMGEWNSEAVVEAAKMADVHELILRLPNGYDTRVNTRSGMLSGGQLQRIGLARALYGGPKFVVLDEPNTNLDEAGERALINAVKRMKAQGTTLIVIAHNSKVLAQMDTIMVLNNGVVSDFGKARDILVKYEKADALAATAQLTAIKKEEVKQEVANAPADADVAEPADDSAAGDEPENKDE